MRSPSPFAKHGFVHLVWRTPSFPTTQYCARNCSQITGPNLGSWATAAAAATNAARNADAPIPMIFIFPPSATRRPSHPSILVSCCMANAATTSREEIMVENSVLPVHNAEIRTPRGLLMSARLLPVGREIDPIPARMPGDVSLDGNFGSVERLRVERH